MKARRMGGARRYPSRHHAMMAKTFLLGQLFQSRAAHLTGNKTMGIACAQPILPLRIVQSGWLRDATGTVAAPARGLSLWLSISFR
jgi:hypothetical protein